MDHYFLKGEGGGEWGLRNFQNKIPAKFKLLKEK